MQAQAGDRILIHGRTVGSGEQYGEILEVRGHNGSPPYLVRFSDGHQSLLYPGPDSEITHRVE